MSISGYAVPPYVFEDQGTSDAPFTYTIPASLEIRPDTATATFDGTGASGDFLACLTFYSPEGALLCRMFNPNAVKQGDTAVVTYIPPFGAAASSSSTGGGITEIDSPNGTISVTNPTGPIVDIDVAFTLQNEVVTASPKAISAGTTDFFSLSHSSGDTLLKYTAPGSATHPLIIHAGLYMFSASVDVQTVTTNPDYSYLAVGTAGSFPRQAWTMFNNTGGPSEVTLTGVRVCVSGDDASVSVFNQSANNYTYDLDSYTVTRLAA